MKERFASYVALNFMRNFKLLVAILKYVVLAVGLEEVSYGSWD